jgi:hypothetical protein
MQRRFECNALTPVLAVLGSTLGPEIGYHDRFLMILLTPFRQMH